jgi:hypothetical protein
MNVADIARVVHEANRAVQRSLSEEVNPPWDQAPEWMQESTVKGVEGIQAGNTPEESHAAWMQDRIERGWVWGKFKSELAKTHPDLVAYEELPREQQLKDTLFHAITTILT